MIKQGRWFIILIISVGLMSGCLSSLWTGASLVYDRHNVYKKLNDYHIVAEINSALYKDKKIKNNQCVIDIAVFNGDVLLAGHVPNQEIRDEIKHRLRSIKGYRHLFFEIAINNLASNSVQDTWITTKIRSQIFADDSIDPNAFKITTSDRVVYVMGDVRPEQAQKVIKISRLTNGVDRVVTILKYFTYTQKRNMA